MGSGVSPVTQFTVSGYYDLPVDETTLLTAVCQQPVIMNFDATDMGLPKEGVNYGENTPNTSNPNPNTSRTLKSPGCGCQVGPRPMGQQLALA
jgi:hypothetical protein